MHTHTYLGQTLRHEHPGGDQPHGYYGHEEDKGGPAYGAGTYERLGKATAGSGGVARVEVTRTGARTERTRYYTLGLLPASERGRAVLVVQNNYTGHAESYALPNGMRLVAVGTEPEPGELCNACGRLLGPAANPESTAGLAAGFTAQELDALVTSAVELWEQADDDVDLNEGQQAVLSKARTAVYEDWGVTP